MRTLLPLKLSILFFFCFVLFWGWFVLFIFILIDSVRQEWWSVNVWLSYIWTKLLLIKVSAEIARYEITQLCDNRRVKIGSSIIRLDSSHQKTRSCQSEQMTELYMENFPEVGMDIFHLHLLVGVPWLLLSCCCLSSLTWWSGNRGEIDLGIPKCPLSSDLPGV